MIMANAATAALAFLFIFASIAHAQSIEPPPLYSNHTLSLRLSMPDGALPPDSIIYVNYADEHGIGYSTAIVAKQSGEAALYTNSEVKWLSLSYDDISTPAVDGAWSGEITGGGRVAIMLQPVSQVAGTVISESGQNPAGAQVELHCSSGTVHSANVSGTGAFSFGSVPSGECIISAGSRGEFAQQNVNLSHGSFSTVQLTLRKPRDYSYAILAALAVVILGAWLFFSRKKKEPEAKKQPGAKRKLVASSPQTPTARQKDLLATLDTKEKGIVEYLMHHHPSSVKVPKMRRDLLMPKTSLTRTLQALERKQFLKIEKLGARQYVKLHEFFLKQ
ncbi:Carboxypeptidase regulatory-like domain protein [uncultured archaeon]|nr:Carboxypeptidase regulatory-like domain protein [uncultured archaeon]